MSMEVTKRGGIARVRAILLGGSAAAFAATCVVACGGGETVPPAAPAVPLVIGTSAPAPTAASSGVTAPNGPFADRLAAARALRDEALSHEVPRYKGDGSKASRLAFVQTKVKDWFEAAKPATEHATEAYRHAYDAAGTPQERALAASEAADLQATFCTRFVAAGSEGEPDDWKSNVELHDTFQDSLLGALVPFVKNASITVDRCLVDASVDTADTRRCAALRPVLAGLTPKPAGSARRTVTAPATSPPPRPAGCMCDPGDPLCRRRPRRSRRR